MIRSNKSISSPPRNRFGSGFTLVELLVVLAIIAVLLTLLVPTISKVRQVATTLSCVARMKQLNTASMTFASDHGGHFPPVFAGSSTTYTFPWGFYQSIFPWDVSTPKRALETGYLTRYLSAGTPDYKLYLCPFLEQNFGGLSTVSTTGNRSYLYNRYLGGAPANWWSLPGTSSYWRNSLPYKWSQVKDANTCAVFLCMAGRASGVGSGGNQLWFRQDDSAQQGAYSSPKAYALPTGANGIMLHQGVTIGGTYTDWTGGQSPKCRGFVNAAFADGSVRSIYWTVDRFPAKPIDGLRIYPDIPTGTW